MIKIPKEMVLKMLQQIDYDISKNYEEETAEDSDEVIHLWDQLDETIFPFGFQIELD